jgi:hypothetical protein
MISTIVGVKTAFVALGAGRGLEGTCVGRTVGAAVAATVGVRVARVLESAASGAMADCGFWASIAVKM